LPLAFLWWRLIDHLHVEWTVNPQYSYGWAVPFLCAYLIWQRWQHRALAPSCSPQPTTRNPQPTIASSPCAPFFVLPSSIIYLLIALCALLYAPTRLVQEANPEWRLISWTLAFIVIGLTFALVLAHRHHAPPDKPQPATHDLPSPIFDLRVIAFPVLFFVVAVPWPTVIEGPLIQALARANAAVTIEILGAFGIPALQRGNIIEIATGVVGIDDACSGIRSFQATLMISLFLGELYRLTLGRRVGLCLIGFALAFVFNVARTTVLVWVASRSGVDAIAAWHDPAGITILVACFLSLWVASIRMDGSGAGVPPATVPPAVPAGEASADRASGERRMEDGGWRMDDSGASVPPATVPPAVPAGEPHPVASDNPHISRITRYASLPIALCTWIALVEVGTEWWYRSHETGLAKSALWTVELPRENGTFREVPFSDTTRQFLRYDEGVNGAWMEEEDGTRWQAVFLRWNPGRIAVHLAKSHTPEVCLAAAGGDIVSMSDMQHIRVNGLEMPVRSYVVRGANESGPVHVFYTLWEERANEQSFATTSLTYANRLGPVLAGRRNAGQRSLQVAVWGIDDPHEAAAQFKRQLERLVKVM
jgi:exosortase/archaeosortase family protein